uniref:Nardilysin convertase n=1 Tax=Pipistrellus kuhlii TaxID=59472 RepID=A0A7J8A953_PIPKU|nr:nardilysin convertase [Pipistrellus kuhlii]
MLRRVAIAAVSATGRKLWCAAGRELAALWRTVARGRCEDSAEGRPFPAPTMPGRNKAKSTCSCPDLQPGGQDSGESGRVARLGVDESEEQGRRGPINNAGDPEIVKSPSDPKQYRYIKLRNGLQALLISDLSNTEGKTGDATDDEDEDEEEDDDEDDDEEEDDDDDDDDDDEDEDSGAEIEDDDEEGFDDENEFDNVDEHDNNDLDAEVNEMEELEERAEARKKTTEKQSAAALCVGVGSFADPDDLPGLAHFLEHSKIFVKYYSWYFPPLNLSELISMITNWLDISICLTREKTKKKIFMNITGEDLILISFSVLRI